ncbi:MAG: 6-phosphogluconolactonase [Dehalococcoidia bacterium]|nr:6-phosphogluconolactonase [Dehalococcoidia bacterium]
MTSARPQLIVTDNWVEAALAVIIEARPRTWALAGGSTPRQLYERLATVDLPWADIEVFFGDERCVPPGDPASNYRMAHEALLRHVPATTHRMPGETADAAAYEAVLRARLGVQPALDLVLLGLGEDGHTASLFPGDSALEERTRLVARVHRPDVDRLTLTLPVLSASKRALFLVTGATKREALRALLNGGPIPAARVHAKRVVVVADLEAGAGIED